MSPPSNTLLKPYLQLHFIVAIWGFTAILGKLISLPPLEIVFYRTLIAAVGLYGVMYFKNISTKVNRQDFFKLVGTGFIIGGHWVTFFLAAELSNISICLAGLATTSLWTSFIEPIVYKRKIELVESLLGLISAIGIAMVFNASYEYKIGFYISIISAMLSATFSVINSKLVISRNHYSISMYEMLGACFISLVFILILYCTGFSDTIYWIGDTKNLFYLLILGGLCTVYAYSIGVKLMKKLSAFSVNLTINLEPVYGILLAILVFKEEEEMNFNFYVGMSFIILSIFIYPFIRKSNIRAK